MGILGKYSREMNVEKDEEGQKSSNVSMHNANVRLCHLSFFFSIGVCIWSGSEGGRLSGLV